MTKPLERYVDFNQLSDAQFRKLIGEERWIVAGVMMGSRCSLLPDRPMQRYCKMSGGDTFVGDNKKFLNLELFPSGYTKTSDDAPMCSGEIHGK